MRSSGDNKAWKLRNRSSEVKKRFEKARTKKAISFIIHCAHFPLFCNRAVKVSQSNKFSLKKNFIKLYETLEKL
jgi:hypothetical protein